MEIHDHGHWQIITIIMTACFTFIFGHNLWLVAANEDDRRDKNGGNDEIIIEVVTSDHFPVSDSAVKPERVAEFTMISAEETTTLTDYRIEGDSLVAIVPAKPDMRFAALELYAHPIVLEADKFAGYIRSEEAESSVAPNFVEGVTAKPQRESYSKFAKVMFVSLFDVRPEEVSQEAIGHRLEIVLINDSVSLEKKNRLLVKVLFEGIPIENLRVSLGCQHENNGKYSAHARTDMGGQASFEISSAGLWFVRTHYIRPHENADEFDWESFWASLTFRI